MASAICGSKRSFFEDIPSPPVSKRFRCFSPSQSPLIRSPPPPLSTPSPLDQLRSVFPDMDVQVLERALQECDYDLDTAIKSLNQLSLAPTDLEPDSAPELRVERRKGEITNDRGDATAAVEKPPALDNLPSRSQWVELLVREMANATSPDDAKVRASSVLEMLEKSISSQVGQESAQNFQKEHSFLKQHVEVLARENSFLKRFVAAQHERQKQYENLDRETQHLKQLISQYQERLRTLEVNNYALTMYLKQTGQTCPVSGHLPPDVF